MVDFIVVALVLLFGAISYWMGTIASHKCTQCGYDATEYDCPECGKEYKDKTNYCLQCGHIRYKASSY
jgi:anaerobic ribonucleoside-triphosphate reductase